MAERTVKKPKSGVSRLREILADQTGLSVEADAASSYLDSGAGGENLVAAVYPATEDEIRLVLELAGRHGFSIYSPIPGGLNPPRPGIVLDPKNMAEIKQVDTRNLFLEVEPGVTWEQLLTVLAKAKVGVALPAAAKSPFVLDSVLEREIVLSANRLSNRQLATFRAILADGRDYASGSDALSGSGSHWREDGGPNISRIFTGSRNSFGIPVSGFVYLYPKPENRKVVVLGLPNRKSACVVAQRFARSELGNEILVINKLKAKEALGEDPGLATWSAVFGLEGSARMVEHQQKRLDQLARELKLKPKKGSAKATRVVSAGLEMPWYAPPVSLGFYTNWSRVEELGQVVEAALKSKGKLAQMVVSVKRGASVYVQFDLADATKDAAGAIKKLAPRLANKGAFFANPTGPLASHIFMRQPGYFKLMKEVKRFIDPDDILNSGQVVEV